MIASGMNKPYINDYEAMVITEPQYTHDLEDYCYECEQQMEVYIKDILLYAKALNKACEQLSMDGNKTIDEWKEWCLKND